MTEERKRCSVKRLEESKSCRLWYEGMKFEFYSTIKKIKEENLNRIATKFKLKKKRGIRSLFAKLSFAIAIKYQNFEPPGLREITRESHSYWAPSK